MASPEEELLRNYNQQIQDAWKLLAQQRQRIRETQEKGEDSSLAENMNQAFERAIEELEYRIDVLEAAIQERNRPR